LFRIHQFTDKCVEKIFVHVLYTKKHPYIKENAYVVFTNNK
jgi:hypothetical protein